MKARKLLKGMLGSRRETVDDVLVFMSDYAEAMRKRHREAVSGDKSIACDIVSLRMEDTASRIKAALRRERASWRAKVRKSRGEGR